MSSAQIVLLISQSNNEMLIRIFCLSLNGSINLIMDCNYHRNVLPCRMWHNRYHKGDTFDEQSSIPGQGCVCISMYIKCLLRNRTNDSCRIRSGITFSTALESTVLGLPILTCLSRFLQWGCPRGVMVKAMDCGIVVREFVLQSCYHVHFRANTLGKGMNPLILPAMG